MNTELARAGLTFTTAEWLRVNVDAPEVVAGIHARYATAGAELHIANSFSAARHVLEAAGIGDRFESINRASVELCREAIDAAAPHRQWIAGSISTYAAGHDRRNLPGLDELERNCADQACVLADAGADLIALEMLSDADTCAAMMRGAAEAGLPVSLGLICFRDESGRVMLFGRGRDNLYAGENVPLDEVLPSIVERMPAGLRLVIAVMHSSTEDTGPAIAVVRSCWDGDIAAYPNTGDYDSGGWDWTDAQDAGGVCRQLRAVGGPGGSDRRRMLRIRPRAHPRDVGAPCRIAIGRAVVRGDADDGTGHRRCRAAAPSRTTPGRLRRAEHADE